MTVTYSKDIETAKSLTLLKLLFLRWRGSLLKLIWKDMIVYLAIYMSIRLTYVYALHTDEARQTFEQIVDFFTKYKELVPISFVLGFFVANVMGRWWDQFMSIPWPFTIAIYVSSTVQGYDEVGRAMRRTIMRYVCLSLTMVFRVLSSRVKARFPKMSDLISAGLLNNNELTIIEGLDAKYPMYQKNFLPIVWAASLVNKAREEGRIKNDFASKTIIEELNKFRGSCGLLMAYNTICIPLVYTQVVTIAVYFYLLLTLFAMQNVQKNEVPFMMWEDFPLLTTLQFLFYMGWLKVAESMINPFGNDDDDFEVTSIIDNNLAMSYLIVDEMHHDHPELLKDQYWDEIVTKLPDKLPEDQKKEQNIVKDIFDVPPPQKRKTAFAIDLESNLGEEPITKASRPDLIPRATVIDQTYLNKTDVEAQQSFLESKMELEKLKRTPDARISMAAIRKLECEHYDDDIESIVLAASIRRLGSKSLISLAKPTIDETQTDTAQTSVKDVKAETSGSESDGESQPTKAEDEEVKVTKRPSKEAKDE